MPQLTHVERAFWLLNQSHEFNHIDLMHLFGITKHKARRILMRAKAKQMQRDAFFPPRITIVA